MQTYTYVSKGKFELTEKPKPVIMHERDAIVKVTLASICSSDLHIKHGSVPRAVLGITVGHEMVGIVEEVGTIDTISRGANSAVLTIRAEKVLAGTKVGDSIAVNGICLTVTRLMPHAFTADVMHETLNRSSLANALRGAHVKG